MCWNYSFEHVLFWLVRLCITVVDIHWNCSVKWQRANSSQSCNFLMELLNIFWSNINQGRQSVVWHLRQRSGRRWAGLCKKGLPCCHRGPGVILGIFKIMYIKYCIPIHFAAVGTTRYRHLCNCYCKWFNVWISYNTFMMAVRGSTIRVDRWEWWNDGYVSGIIIIIISSCWGLYP